MRPTVRRSRDEILAGWQAGVSVDHAFASTWDAGGDAGLATFLVAHSGRDRRSKCPSGHADPLDEQNAPPGAGAQSDRPAADLELGYHRSTYPVARCGVQGVLDHRHLLPQNRGLASGRTRVRRPRCGDVRGGVRRSRTTRSRARRLRAGDALIGPQRPAGRSRDRSDPQPAAGQQ